MITNLHEFLINKDACDEAKEWASNKSWNEIYNTCHRGDWLLWLFKKTNPNDLQRLTLAKGHCAATVLHLMKDERSKQAVNIAIAFGEGKSTQTELDAAADAAYGTFFDAYGAYDAAPDAAYSAYTAAAADASFAVAAYASYAVVAAYAADDAFADDAFADDASFDAAAAADAKNQLETADICRQYLPIEIWNIVG
jgi:hypothetical protein